MKVAESTDWLLAGLVYRKITKDKHNCKVHLFLWSGAWQGHLRDHGFRASVCSQCFVPSVSCQNMQGESKEKTRTVLHILSSSPGAQLGPGEQWVNGSLLKTASCPRQIILEGDKGPEKGRRCSSFTELTDCQDGEKPGICWQFGCVGLIYSNLGLLSAPRFALIWSKKNT